MAFPEPSGEPEPQAPDAETHSCIVGSVGFRISCCQLRLEYLKGVLLHWMSEPVPEDPENRTLGRQVRESEASSSMCLCACGWVSVCVCVCVLTRGIF